MKNDSNRLFANNLIKIYQMRKYNSINEMSKDFCIPTGTLKCWITSNRSPKLTNLDVIANKLGCYTFNLIKQDGDFSDVNIYNNDIHRSFVRQLRIIFINYQAKTYLNKLYLLNNVVSYDTLVSYLRQNNYRLPTLKTLDRIADELDINAYELIKE